MGKLRIPKPYYTVSGSIIDQIKGGSKRSGLGKASYFFKKLNNYVMQLMAYNCPFNSLRIKFHRLRGVTIGRNVLIGFQVTLDHSYPEMIIIEDDVSLAGNNYILAHSNPYPHFSKVLESFIAQVRIKQGAWLGVGAMVMPDVTIGEYSIISAGSVVTKSIPPKVIAGGIPAKILKEIGDNL